MDSSPYKIIVVLDREFGEKISELPHGVPIWIIDSGVNRELIKRFWKDHPDESHLTGRTIFNGAVDSSTEDILVSLLDQINLHHGVHSADPPFTVIEVIGASPNESTKVELATYGFEEISLTAGGFSTSRPLPTKSS